MFFSANKTIDLDKLTVSSDNIAILQSPEEFKSKLIELIRGAKQRIYLTALYLQDDEAGREILSELYQVKLNQPDLVINIFVDYHRAQRGLIGERDSLGNRALYLKLAEQHPGAVHIYGVPVKTKELFGVLHLKGYVIDNHVLYSGASINNVYLHQENKYRYDRYHLLNDKNLADTFVNFADQLFVHSNLAPLLNTNQLPSPRRLKRSIRQLKAKLKKASYTPVRKSLLDGDIHVTPLLGFGLKGNKLNKAIHQLFKYSTQSLVIFTPYFNLPKSLVRDLKRALRRGVKVDIVVGDKKANDFFIPSEAEFSTIGIVPYIYETLLLRFVRKFQSYIDSGHLNIHLWQDQDNSFHLKGVVADDRRHLITGSNLNPRAWGLDLENGLLIDDPQQQLLARWQQEYLQITLMTKRVNSCADIDSINDYPDKAKELLKKLKISQIDHVLKRLL